MRLNLSSRPAEASSDDFALKKSLMFTNALRQLRHRFNRPFMVMFETTLHCNMKCGYCAIWQNQQPENLAERRGIDGLPTILSALDYIKGHLRHNTNQINAAVDLENLEDLPALAEYCEERGFLLHTEAVHNVVRTTWKTEDVEMRKEELDQVAAFVSELRKQHKCVRFYRDYFKFYRNDGFTKKFPCRSASHLVNMRPDGSIQFTCAYVSLHRCAADMRLREIYESPEVREIIRQSPQMWDFCKGCKIGCPYEVSAYRNSPLTAIRGALDFIQLS